MLTAPVTIRSAYTVRIDFKITQRAGNYLPLFRIKNQDGGVPAHPLFHFAKTVFGQRRTALVVLR